MKVSHEIFAENVAVGVNHTEAYLKAFPNCRSRNSARANAARLIARDDVKERIRVFRDRAEKSCMLTYQEKRAYLAKVVRDPNSLAQAVIKALQVDNQMAGHNAPTEITGEVTLGAILRDLKSTPLVNPRRVAPLPIQSAGGGSGKLPEHTGSGNEHSTGNEGEKELIRCTLGVSGADEGILLSRDPTGKSDGGA